MYRTPIIFVNYNCKISLVSKSVVTRLADLEFSGKRKQRNANLTDELIKLRVIIAVFN